MVGTLLDRTAIVLVVIIFLRWPSHARAAIDQHILAVIQPE
jgi:hypothetical protein